MERYTAYNVAVILFAAFGSWLSGYGLAVIIATLGQPSFYTSLNLDADPSSPGYRHTNDFIATIQGILFAGGFFGAIFAAVASRFGRVRGFQICASFAIAGGAIQTGARNQGMYILARFITGFATGHAFAAMPVYFAEVAPPHSRGFMAGAHGCFINVGYASANWIGFGTFYSSTSFAWRFPNAVFIILALCFLAGTFFIPESPRWLVSKGRDAEALRVLGRLHHDRNDAEDTFAAQEVALIRRQINEDTRALREGGRWQILTMKTYRIRLILSCMIVIGTQNTGILVINSYNTLLYQSLGLSNTESLIVSAAYNTWGMIANFMGAPISDRMGRRKLLLIGFISTFLMFAIATGLIAKYNETPSRSWAAVAVIFLYLYVFCYACFIDVNCWTVASEIFPSHLRSQGTGIAMSTLFLTDLLWLQLAPTASATIGWKYYLVFIGLTFFSIVFLWFKLPETSGLALEEIDRLFGKEPASQLSDADLEVEMPKTDGDPVDYVVKTNFQA
ncbi:uncharacterized protein A1O9_09764 [Exophiala aquamarina CBS 119918]|uniref:Major facilitator superfamily (MFS) profile domain-containing protein n=1 Tax=Exophiala aquamarina CBS 119918 TaxID=1182545 RepID=A0A072P1H6_9EURO|nr:uncharacterized protein A1O9_09764 [Exophiala aquamarina CBS 119918]KEF53969.1 hypothetical protein A1O9_09764 [Exophiala aquamarina CBS 119918]